MVAACLCDLACQPQLSTRPPDLGPPGGYHAAPPKPLTFDPFTSPFAWVEAKPKQAECSLPDDDAAKKWAVVPPPAATSRSQGPIGPRVFDGEVTGFCVYKWRNEDKPPSRADFRRIGAIPDGAVIATRDYPPAEIPKLPDTVSDFFRKSFDKLARGISPERWKDLAKRHLDNPKKPVRVAVVDTTPKGLLDKDNSTHGFSVANVIARLLCSDPGSNECADRVRPYLALPMNGPRSEDFVNGGRFGTFFQLYDALSQALRDWPRGEHLVINLSLGWDPVKTDDDDPRVARIKELLERASCMGALIIAGAGNPTGTEGPVLPSAFEEFAAPDSRRCEDLNAPMPAPPTSRAEAKAKATIARVPTGKDPEMRYSPLVYAVGALDWRDQRLMADRRWGQPSLAALGLNVMVPASHGIPFTAPLTGTSAPTAIVSGIAAAVWSVLPDLDAPSVMAIVYGGGVELDGGEKSKHARTEFCLGEHFGPCLGRKVHRAFLCGALSQALAEAAARETLVCDTSILSPKEGPKWPDTTVGKERPEPLEPCHIPACGLPMGPTADQRVSGITSHGFANCPGCSISINLATRLLTLHGFPGLIDPSMLPTDTFKARVDIAFGKTPVSYPFDPAPPFGQDMSGSPQMSGMGMSGKATAATITFWHWRVSDWEQDTPINLGPPTTE
jgi:hypothetical protein